MNVAIQAVSTISPKALPLVPVWALAGREAIAAGVRSGHRYPMPWLLMHVAADKGIGAADLRKMILNPLRAAGIVRLKGGFVVAA